MLVTFDATALVAPSAPFINKPKSVSPPSTPEALNSTGKLALTDFIPILGLGIPGEAVKIVLSSCSLLGFNSKPSERGCK